MDTLSFKISKISYPCLAAARCFLPLVTSEQWQTSAPAASLWLSMRLSLLTFALVELGCSVQAGVEQVTS